MYSSSIIKLLLIVLCAQSSHSKAKVLKPDHLNNLESAEAPEKGMHKLPILRRSKIDKDHHKIDMKKNGLKEGDDQIMLALSSLVSPQDRISLKNMFFGERI